MEIQLREQIRGKLLEKRKTLAEWLDSTPPEARQVHLGPVGEDALESHLAVLDTAADRAAEGTLGVCEVCHETVNHDLLQMDYTACVCLSHLPDRELRKLESELELAASVQRSLLPARVPDTPALDIAAFSRPAQIIGGDYFDFFRFRDGAHGLAVADVAGHGISASLHMASVQALLSSLIPGSDSPADVIAHLQRLLIHNVHFSTFVTLFLGAFDPATCRFAYSNAGHNPPLVWRDDGAGGEAYWLWPTGAAIGLVEESIFGLEMIQLAPGDVLLLYTDGVVEARNAREEEFGNERLAQAVARNRAAPARDLVRAIRQDVESFAGGEPPVDDITLVVCKIAG